MNKNLHNVADLERIAELEAEVERLKVRKETIIELWSAGLDMDLSRQLKEWDAEDEHRVNPSGLSLSAGKPRESCEFCGGPEHKDDSECPAWEGA